MKGIVTIIELIVVVTILFVAFGIFFPPFRYEHRWEDAALSLQARDIFLSLEALGKVYEASFNSTLLNSLTELMVGKPTLLRMWGATQGTFKPVILVACNCSEEQIGNISEWVGKIKVNNRTLELVFLQSSLDRIVPSDALLIWGRKELEPYYQQLQAYAQDGKGVVELMDFSEPWQVNDDRVQTELFDLRFVEKTKERALLINLSRFPDNASELIYFPYKHLSRLPLLLRYETLVDEVPCELEQPKGSITLNQTSFSFWICANRVWIDTDADGVADSLVRQGENFFLSMGGERYEFLLNYVENFSISISFPENWKMSDFLTFIDLPPDQWPPGNPAPPGRRRAPEIQPSDSSKILLLATLESGKRVPAAIVNQKVGKFAWIPDLLKRDERTGLPREVQDDEKLLVASLLLWASAKKAQILPGEPAHGILTSYVNVVNKDMFEVYEFQLAPGYPY